MFSNSVIENLKRSSWIRAMFEQGNKLREIYGSENVFDFSIGNPDIEPPKEVTDAIKAIAEDKSIGMHRYMPNAGYPFVKSAIAKKLSFKYKIDIPSENICMVCGAAAGLNVVFKSILNPNEEIIIFAPYFAEYKFYIGNGGGVPVVVETTGSFQIDTEAFKDAITHSTKAVLLNSPNNPTGVIYKEETLMRMAEIIKGKETELGINIIVVSDEPYNEIVYDIEKLPVMFNIFEKVIVVNSYSKSLALPGERIGYIAVSSKIKDCDTLMAAIIFNNRTLGFVNAPAMAQRIVEKAINASVNPDIYKERRDILYNHLVSLGFECQKPDGAFYLFVKSPVEDELEFVKTAQEFNVLVVPGRGFGRAGYFRISFCVNLDTIKRSLPAFDAIAKKYFK